MGFHSYMTSLAIIIAQSGVLIPVRRLFTIFMRSFADKIIDSLATYKFYGIWYYLEKDPFTAN